MTRLRALNKCVVHLHETILLRNVQRHKIVRVTEFVICKNSTKNQISMSCWNGVSFGTGQHSDDFVLGLITHNKSSPVRLYTILRYCFKIVIVEC